MFLISFIVVIIAIISSLYWYSDYIKEFPTCIPEDAAIVITGCSSGIGYHATHYMANKGYVVYAAVRKETDFVKFNNNTKIIPLIMDVTNITTMNNAKEFISKHLEVNKLHLVGLVNNAGIGYAAAVSEANLNIFKNVMEVNVYGFMSAVQYFLPLLCREHENICGSGRIVNIGSVSGLVASPLYG